MPELNIPLINKGRLTVVAWLLFFALSPLASHAKEWRGITPAVSTRNDVVRLLRQCSDRNARCEFDTDEGGVFILFSGAGDNYFQCPARLPADTVMQIEVAPKAKLRLSDLSGGANFKELAPPDPNSFGYRVYLDEDSGLMVRASDGVVNLVSYLAAAKDTQACPNYYGMVESESVQYPLCRLPLPEPSKFTEVGEAKQAGSSRRSDDDTTALDGFVGELREQPSAQAYVIAYAGRKARAGEAQARAERARAYLMSKHGMEAGRVLIVDGGYREEAALELFIVPAGATPPSPTPNVDPKEVQIVPDKRVRKPR